MGDPDLPPSPFGTAVSILAFVFVDRGGTASSIGTTAGTDPNTSNNAIVPVVGVMVPVNGFMGWMNREGFGLGNDDRWNWTADGFLDDIVSGIVTVGFP